jgi:hypothetical protein
MKQRVVQEPLVGVVDGYNMRFNLASPPATATPTMILADGTAVTASTFDRDSGALLFASAPMQTIYASYTHSQVAISDGQGLFDEAFALMQGLWSRAYYIIEDNVSGVRTLSTSNVAIVDPTIGDLAFAQRPAQVALFVDCMFYQWVRSSLAEATYNAIAVREQRASGLQIDRTRQPDQFKTLLDDAKRRVEDSLAIAMSDAGESVLYEGGAVGGTRSLSNTDDAWWQSWNYGVYEGA